MSAFIIKRGGGVRESQKGLTNTPDDLKTRIIVDKSEGEARGIYVL